MFKKSLTLLLCLSFMGCSSPQKQAETLAESINQESLKKEEKGVSGHVVSTKKCPVTETAGYFLLLPFKQIHKGLSDLVPVLIGFAKIPVILVELPKQIFHDAGASANQVGKAVVPPQKTAQKE